MGAGPVIFSVEQQNLLWAMRRDGESIREMERKLGETMPPDAVVLASIRWDRANTSEASIRSSDPGRS